MIGTRAAIGARLWPKIDRSAGADGCWPWTAMRMRTGYGMIRAGGRTQKAARIVWAVAIGPIPDGMHVLHRCDNPPCCNPAHLFLGTHADNMADKVAKGRQARTGNRVCALKTHCPQGHEYSPENTTIYRTMRYCRTCATHHKRAYKERKRGS